MSGVLDRMAKRALGSLPTIQPVASPHYAPRLGGGVRANLLEWDATFSSEAFQSKASDRASGAGRPTSTGPEASGRDGESTGAAEGGEAFKNARRPPYEDSNAGSSNSGSGRQPGWDGQSDMETRGPSRPAGEPDGNDAGMAHAAKLFADPASSGDPLAMERQPQFDGEGETPRQRKKSGLEVLAAPIGPTRRSPRGAGQAEAAAAAESKTEVHISIGSIELRAPRGEARAAVAPFRPRVSLGDFLRRKPEAGA